MPGAISRWDPFADLAELRGPFERLLNGLPFDGDRWTPAIDVERHDGDLVVRADVPGVKPDEVKIEIENNLLTVSGEHRESSEKKDKHYLRRERHYGGFSRTVALPEGVDAKKVSARTHDGVVVVTVPLPQEPKAKRVEIKATTG